jgi:hypothetical protein
MSIEGKFAQLKAIIQLAEDDMNKFYYRHNKSAGIRLRRNMKDVKDLAAEIRKDVLEMKKEKV